MIALKFLVLVIVAAANVQADGIYYGTAANGTISTMIPRINTPGCSYNLTDPASKSSKAPFPPLFLSECTQPLASTAVDLRGLWQDVEFPDNPMERIEQCGLRIIVTAGGVIHDTYLADGTIENGVHDVSFNDCSPIEVAGKFDVAEKTFTFYYANGTEVVSRRRVNDTNMEWIHPLTGVTNYHLVQEGDDVISAASIPTSAALSTSGLLALIFMLFVAS